MQTNNQTDYDLVKQFIAGSSSGIEKLIKRHKNKVFTYIIINVKNNQLAEDIFQETFIKVINSLKQGKYKDEGRFVSWVIRIAHNLIIDHYRKLKNMQTCSADVPEYNLFNSMAFAEKNIEDDLIFDQITRDVRDLIELLPDDQKEVIVLRHFVGLSFKEIAEQTNVSINTALGRMRYALINLRKIIEEKKLSLTY